MNVSKIVEMYEEMLDDVWGVVQTGGKKIPTSRELKILFRSNYAQGLREFVDSLIEDHGYHQDEIDESGIYEYISMH